MPLGKELLLQRRVHRVSVGQDAQLETVCVRSSHERSVYLRLRVGALREKNCEISEGTFLPLRIIPNEHKEMPGIVTKKKKSFVDYTTRLTPQILLLARDSE